MVKRLKCLTKVFEPHSGQDWITFSVHPAMNGYLTMVGEGCRRKERIEQLYMSRVVRKLAFCICENKDADQLRGNREADQRLCFHYIASTIPLFPKYKISSF